MFKLPLIIKYPWQITHVMVVHLFNLVGFTALSLRALFSGKWCFSISRLGVVTKVQLKTGGGGTTWFQWFCNRCPLIIRCLEMARAYNSMFTDLQLKDIYIELSLCTYLYVDPHNNVSIDMLFVLVEYYV